MTASGANEATRQLMGILVRIRKARKLSQVDVAERMGVSRSLVARIEARPEETRLSELWCYAEAIGAEVHLVAERVGQ